MAAFYDYSILGTNCLTHPRVLIVYLVDTYGTAKLNNIKNYYVHISVCLSLSVSLCVCEGRGGGVFVSMLMFLEHLLP